MTQKFVISHNLLFQKFSVKIFYLILLGIFRTKFPIPGEQNINCVKHEVKQTLRTLHSRVTRYFIFILEVESSKACLNCAHEVLEHLF